MRGVTHNRVAQEEIWDGERIDFGALLRPGQRHLQLDIGEDRLGCHAHQARHLLEHKLLRARRARENAIGRVVGKGTWRMMLTPKPRETCATIRRKYQLQYCPLPTVLRNARVTAPPPPPPKKRSDAQDADAPRHLLHVKRKLPAYSAHQQRIDSRAVSGHNAPLATDAAIRQQHDEGDRLRALRAVEVLQRLHERRANVRATARRTRRHPAQHDVSRWRITHQRANHSMAPRLLACSAVIRYGASASTWSANHTRVRRVAVRGSALAHHRRRR